MFEHRIFPEKRVYRYRSMLLRGGGHPDKYHTMFRDAMGSHLPQEYTHIDRAGYRPAVLYINGEYWGMYNIREKINASFIQNNYSLDKAHFDMLQDSWKAIKNGSRKHFLLVEQFLRTCEKTPENYAQLGTLIDLNNFIDYNICELYSSNLDWPNWNIKYYRPREENARWKWILIDLDFGFGNVANTNGSRKIGFSNYCSQ